MVPNLSDAGKLVQLQGGSNCPSSPSEIEDMNRTYLHPLLLEESQLPPVHSWEDTIHKQQQVQCN